MLSYELCKGVWGTVSIVDVAGIQVKDGLVALRGRGQKNGTWRLQSEGLILCIS